MPVPPEPVMPDLLHDSRTPSPVMVNPTERSEVDSATLRGGQERNVALDYSWQLFRVSLPMLLGDLFAIFASLLTAFAIVLVIGKEVNHFMTFAILDVLAMAFCLWAHGIYPGIGLGPAHELRQLFRASVSCSLAICCVLVMFTSIYSPYVWMVAMALPLQLAGMPVIRNGVRSWMRHLSFGVPFFFLGERKNVMRAYKNMRQFGWNMLVPAGRFEWLRDEESFSAVTVLDDEAELEFERCVNYLGTAEEVQRHANSSGIYWLCLVDEVPPMTCSELLQEFPGVIWVQSTNSLAPASAVMHCGLAQGVLVEQNLILPAAKFQKRLVDVLVAGTALLLLSPLILLLSAIVKFSSSGSVFFFHERIGRGGRTFKAWKFRSMVSNAQEILSEHFARHPELLDEWNRDHKLRDDPRITWIGGFLRKTSLDELPQLWNVLRGDMSLVGPRPIVEEEISKYGSTFEDYLRVAPGITGLWQISGRNDTTYAERLILDEYYVRNWSPWLDLYILLRTIKTVLLCEGAY